jgi:polysaccharide deacetylase 2 family uncharacterized protein YibQ
MAPKKQTRKSPKRTSKKRTSRIRPWQQLKRALLGLSLLVLLVAAASYLTARFVTNPKESAQQAPLVSKKILSPPQVFEIYPKENGVIPHSEPILTPTMPSDTLPKVAIIIDDIGYDKYIVKKFIDLDAPLTFSMLPFSPFEKEISRAARQKGIEIMLHLPMEPMEYPIVNPGPGALLSSMSADELIAQLKKNLQSVSNIKGVNNHMGSKMTQHSAQMHQIFSILKKEDLYFIDSRTTSKTLCKPSAMLLKVPFAERDVFLDHIPESDFIEKQLKRLIQTARKQGYAIGIGHPHSETHRVLKKMLPKLKKKVRLVPASQIVRLAN